MSEAGAIARSREPVTAQSLGTQLSGLGIAAGQVLLVHCSLSALGWVCGGAVAVIEALLEAVGPRGTVAMPAHSTDLSEPANWSNPPVPGDWCGAIRATMPAFDPRRTPTRRMGALDDPMGDASPLGRLYGLDARIVLAGVGHDRNTSLHLAERRAFGPLQARTRTGSPMMVEGRRQWVEYDEPLACSDDFAMLGEAFEAANDVPRPGTVRVLRLRKLVDFGAQWLAAHRQPDGRPWTASSSAG